VEYCGPEDDVSTEHETIRVPAITTAEFLVQLAFYLRFKIVKVKWFFTMFYDIVIFHSSFLFPAAKFLVY